MPLSATQQLIKFFADGQTQMLDYLQRADERGERQSLATLKALETMQTSLGEIQKSTLEIQKGTLAMQASQQEIALMTTEALKASRESAERTAEILTRIRPH